LTDDELLHSFEDCTLPHREWTHRAHVRVAYLYVKQHPFEIALAKMREGVKRLNAAHGTVESPTSGYSETTTHAFLHLIAATLAAYEGTFPSENADAFCDTHPQLMTRHVLRLFYSPERRMHPEAKEWFEEPDLAKLPNRDNSRQLILIDRGSISVSDFLSNIDSKPKLNGFEIRIAEFNIPKLQYNLPVHANVFVLPHLIRLELIAEAPYNGFEPVEIDPPAILEIPKDMIVSCRVGISSRLSYASGITLTVKDIFEVRDHTLMLASDDHYWMLALRKLLTEDLGLEIMGLPDDTNPFD
jgi:hypothetical protein